MVVADVEESTGDEAAAAEAEESTGGEASDAEELTGVVAVAGSDIVDETVEEETADV